MPGVKIKVFSGLPVEDPHMTPRRRIDKNILWILGLGFGLAILFLLAAGYIGIQTMEHEEGRTAALVEQQRISNSLIYEIQSEDAGLSSLFYLLASSPGGMNHELLLERLAVIQRNVERTLERARATRDGGRWKPVETAVRRFIEEVRRSLRTPPEGGGASDEMYRRHETLVNELSALVAANYEDTVRAQQHEYRRSRDSFRRVLILLFLALGLAVLCAGGTVAITARVFRRMDWQAHELSRLSGHVLETQEEIVHRFSRELHDELGQTLTAIEANLVAIPALSPEQAVRVEDCKLLVQDAIAGTREMSQLLRPSTLDDFGLGPGVQWLADSFSQRSGMQVEVRIQSERRLPEAVETHLFRITQEALTNALRHSEASRIEISLEEAADRLRLVIADNGHGFRHKENGSGFGLIGMRERMSAVGGTLDIHSSQQGVRVEAEVPLERIHASSAYSGVAG
jgi:signal transduction histidine kinase